MATSNSVKIHASCFAGTGSYNYDSQPINGTAGTGPDVASLSNGANTITCPTGAVGFVIIPPTSNSVTITLKGVSGDTGISLSPSQPSCITVGTLPANFVLTTNGSVNVTIVWI